MTDQQRQRSQQNHQEALRKQALKALKDLKAPHKEAPAPRGDVVNALDLPTGVSYYIYVHTHTHTHTYVHTHSHTLAVRDERHYACMQLLYSSYAVLPVLMMIRFFCCHQKS